MNATTSAPPAARPPRAPKAPSGGSASGASALGTTTRLVAPLQVGTACEQAERAEHRRERVRDEWARRELLWSVSALPRVRKCARVAHGEGGAVLRCGAGGSGYAGLIRCASPWSCLGGCRRRISGRWAQRVADLLGAADARGHGSTLATFSIRHHAGQGLGWLLDQMVAAWAQTLRNRPGRRVLERFGVQGQLRVIEITRGDEHGWHPHYHVLFVHDTPLSREMARTFGEQLFDVWVKYLKARGLSAIEHRGGMDCRPVNLGDAAEIGRYLNKAAYELTGEHAKVAKVVGNMTPEQLFDEFRTTGNVAYLELWQEYETATHGRQRVAPSKRLFETYGVNEAESDEEIVAEDAGGDDMIVLPKETWSAIAGRPAGELQIAAEQGGPEAAAAWLDARGLAWSWAKGSPPPASRRERRARRPRA